MYFLQTLLRFHVSVNADVGELLLCQKSGKHLRTRCAAGENNDLVELQVIQKLQKLSGLFALCIKI